MAIKKHCEGKAEQSAIIAHTIYNIDDVPQHSMQLMNSQYDHSCTCQELGDFKQLIYDYFDDVAGSGTITGCFIDIVKSGDKIFGKHSSKYETEVKKDGSWEMTFAGNWEATNGTGKFNGIKGNGTFSGKGTQQGFNFNWEGDFDFPE
jgi:hypothetical protein